MYNAAYLITSTGIRYEQNGRHDMHWLPKIKPSRGLKPNIIAERAEKVFQLMPGRMKKLVIVNGNLLNFEQIQACVKVAEKYADNIMVIPPLLARMMYAIDDIAKLNRPFADETILVVTINHAFIDFVILQRNENFELNIVHREMFKQDRRICMKEFARIYDYYYPHATVILAEGKFTDIGNDIRDEFQPRQLFNRYYNRWDYLLMSGSLLRGLDENQEYHIPNFSMGIETKLSGRNVVILPERTRIPCKIYGVEGKRDSTTLFYFPEHYHLFDYLTYEKMEASGNTVWITGNSNQIIGYYDERGVPYVTNDLNEEKNGVEKEPEMINCGIPINVVAPTRREKAVEMKIENTKSFTKSTQPNMIFAEKLESTPTSEVETTFKFVDTKCAVEIYRNKMTQKIRDSEGNEWTPLYLSMANGIPEIGSKAKNDYQKFPKHVIYDVFKIIGKPLSEIKIDPKWGFKLVETDGSVLFQIETPSGPRLIPQEIVVSAFLKAMKLRAESFWGAENQITEFNLSTNFRLTKAQKVIFEKAAEKNALKILSFIVTDSSE